MIISHKYRFIFIKTRKTAGRSIETYLSSLCDCRDVFTPVFPPEPGHRPRNYKRRWDIRSELGAAGCAGKVQAVLDWLGKRPFRNHSTAAEIKARVNPEIWREYTTFCVDRNPWEKTVSHYNTCRHYRNPPGDFEDYLSRAEYCFHYPSYCDRSGNVLVDRVLHYENLEDELADLFAALGVPFRRGVITNAGRIVRQSKPDYRKVYTDKQKALIERVFSREIVLNGYRF